MMVDVETLRRDLERATIARCTLEELNGLRVIEGPYLPEGTALVLTQPTPMLVNLAELERELARAPRPTS